MASEFPPPFPARPTLYPTATHPSLSPASHPHPPVPLRPLPTAYAYTLAHRCFSLPYRTIPPPVNRDMTPDLPHTTSRPEDPRKCVDEDDRVRHAMECLIGLVLDTIRANGEGPGCREKIASGDVMLMWQKNTAAQTASSSQGEKGWRWEDLFGWPVERAEVMMAAEGSQSAWKVRPIFTMPEHVGRTAARQMSARSSPPSNYTRDKAVRRRATRPATPVTVETAMWDGRSIWDNGGKNFTIPQLKQILSEEVAAMDKKTLKATKKQEWQQMLATKVVAEAHAAVDENEHGGGENGEDDDVSDDDGANDEPSSSFSPDAASNESNLVFPVAPPGCREEDFNFLPFSDLSSWEIQHEGKYRIPFKSNRGRGYSAWDCYTLALLHSPYNPTYWTARGFLYFQQGHYSLALGDLHRAQLLIDVIVNVEARGKQLGLYPRVWDAIEQNVWHVIAAEETEENLRSPAIPPFQLRWSAIMRHQLTKSQAVPFFCTALRKTFHHLISLSLLGLHCYDEYETMEQYLPRRLLLAPRDANLFTQRLAGMSPIIKQRRKQRASAVSHHTNPLHHSHQPGSAPTTTTATAAAAVLKSKNHPLLWRNERLYGWYKAHDPHPSISKWGIQHAHRLQGPTIERLSTTNLRHPSVKLVLNEHPPGGMRVIATARIPRGEIVHAAEPNLLSHFRPTEEPAGWKITAALRRCTNPVAAGAGAAPLELSVTRAARAQGEFICEHCHRRMTRREIEEARRVYRVTGGKADARRGICACLFQDPILPFCTAFLADGLDRCSDLGPGGGMRERDPTFVAGASNKRRGGGEVLGESVAGGRSRKKAKIGDGKNADNDDDDDDGDGGEEFEATVGRGAEFEPHREIFSAGEFQERGPTATRAMADRERLAGEPLSNERLRREGAKIGPAFQGVPEAVGKTCLEIAREKYHYRTCGRDWKWLYEATTAAGVREGVLQAVVRNEGFGTHLAGLLRAVFDVTLGVRDGVFPGYENGEGKWRLAHEIDELIGLDDGLGKVDVWGFGYVANVMVPFDILLALGVDIWGEGVDVWDTWVIQTVIRKLVGSALPWDPMRRGYDDLGDEKPERAGLGQGKQGFPALSGLGVWSGFSFFNHGCENGEWDPVGRKWTGSDGRGANAAWAFDDRKERECGSVPTRLVVWAEQDLEPGDEVRVRYWPHKSVFEDLEPRLDGVKRVLGRKCLCEVCTADRDRVGEPATDPRPPDEESNDGSQERSPSS